MHYSDKEGFRFHSVPVRHSPPPPCVCSQPRALITQLSGWTLKTGACKKMKFRIVQQGGKVIFRGIAVSSGLYSLPTGRRAQLAFKRESYKIKPLQILPCLFEMCLLATKFLPSTQLFEQVNPSILCGVIKRCHRFGRWLHWGGGMSLNNFNNFFLFCMKKHSVCIG